MRVLYITPYYSPAWFYGGPPKCISEQAESLKQHKDIHLEVVALNLNGNVALYAEQTSAVVKEVNGVKVHYLPVLDNKLGKKYFIARNLNTYLQRFIEFDLVHVHTLFNYVSKTGMTFASKNNIPYVVTPHGMLDEVALSRSSFLKKIHRRLYEDRLLKKAKFIQFTTDGELNDAVIDSISNAGVIPLGLSFESSETNIQITASNDDVFKLVFLGRINRIKGINLLLTAFSLIKNKLVNKIFLDLYGDDDDNHLSELQMLITKFNLRNVEFKGKLNPEMRNTTLGEYDCLVLTSYLESFGLVVVEALDLGLPVLISDRVKLASFVLNNNCGWVSSLNAEAIASTIETAYKTSIEERQQMGARGAKVVREKFSLTKVTADLINLYKS